MSGRRPDGAPGNPWLALATVAAGAMMVSLDTTIVAVAQPELQAAFHAPLRAVQWTTTAYLLPLATLLIVAGKTGDRFGHRRVFLIGTIGFTLASGAIGMATTIGGVIAFRAVQGVFGALLQPPTLALLRTTFPADRLSLPIALRSGILGVATAAGPVIGGVLVQEFGWQSVFFLNVPIGIAVAAAAPRTLREARTGPGGAFDPVAVLLMCGCLLTLLWAAGSATRGSVLRLPCSACSRYPACSASRSPGGRDVHAIPCCRLGSSVPRPSPLE